MRKINLTAVCFCLMMFFTVLTTSNLHAQECDPDGDPQTPSLDCPIWNLTVEFTFLGPVVSCTTGGEYKCTPKKVTPELQAFEF